MGLQDSTQVERLASIMINSFALNNVFKSYVNPVKAFQVPQPLLKQQLLQSESSTFLLRASHSAYLLKSPS